MIHAAVLCGFVLAPLAAALHRFAPRYAAPIAAAGPFAIAAYFASLINDVAQGRQFLEATSWVPGLGIELAFRVDGLSLIFALIISAVGGFILVYTGGYLHGHPHLGRMLAFLLMFMASMLGVVLADNLVAMFVFWELTSISSYLLIGFDHSRAKARASALQALLVTGAGGLALLAGAILLQVITGSLSIPELIQQSETIRAHSLYAPALLLILLGAFTKSAQFPFHFWLPSAMEAPTPVSAYLHSATMVKAGIYLLARLSPVLGGTELWTAMLVSAGAVTMLIGGVLSYLKNDLKQILAYSTVSSLGLLTFALGLGGELGTAAAMVFLLAHSLYKGALFMVAGAVDHETGTRDVTLLGGLRSKMPITAVAALLAALSMAGLPPLFGFISKELFYEASQHALSYRELLVGVAFLTGVLTVAAAALAGVRPFWGSPGNPPKKPHEAPLSLWVGPACLAVCGLLFGLLPGIVGNRVISRAAGAILDEPVAIKLALYHGINWTLWLSLFTLATGVALFLIRDRVRPRFAYFAGDLGWGPVAWYEAALAGMMRFAVWQSRVLQNGLLPHYLRVILVSAFVFVVGALVGNPGPEQAVRFSDVRSYEVVLSVLILAGAFAAVRSRSRMAAIASLGVVALGMALTFVLFGAPDLAMTQFLVETLTVILLVLVLYHLPQYTIESSLGQRIRDGLVAVGAGALMGSLVLAVNSVQMAPEISTYYLENSYLLAHGRNVVNVILVDFRGLDTLGEITVLAIASVGVYALLKLRPRSSGDSGKEGAA